MSKYYRTLISRYAEDDLIEIIGYYNEKNEAYAQKLLIKIETRVEELKSDYIFILVLSLILLEIRLL